MAFTRDPVLAVWKAMNLLADVYPDSSELSNLITESEMILFSLITRASARREDGVGGTVAGPSCHPLIA